MRMFKSILIFLIVICILCLFGYAGFNVLKPKKIDDLKVDEQKRVQVVNIDDPHCDGFYCITEYSIDKIGEDNYELNFLFENKGKTDIEKECIKILFSEDKVFYSCYELVIPDGSVKNSIILNDGDYSKFDDFKLVKATEDESKKYYSLYIKDSVINLD